MLCHPLSRPTYQRMLQFALITDPPFLSSSREWFIHFSLCWETSLDFVSNVWYLENQEDLRGCWCVETSQNILTNILTGS